MNKQLSVIIPTLNESGNIEKLVERLKQTLENIIWEAIFVDDNSTDGTQEILNELAKTNDNIKVIHRTNVKGLSSACIAGMLSSQADYLAIMDADLQHDEKLLSKMYALLTNTTDSLDIVIASRFATGASLGEFSSSRKLISKTGNYLARKITKIEFTDPLSGFFMIKRITFKEIHKNLYGKGFKILLL